MAVNPLASVKNGCKGTRAKAAMVITAVVQVRGEGTLD